MKEPTWIRIEVLTANHKELIAEHGGIEGIRDSNLLESACAAPIHMYHYKNPKPSLCELAGKYAYSIMRNHPFLDGNKRMAALACELFLSINDCNFDVSDEDAYFAFKDLAAGEISEEEFAAWLKQNVL
ncbi:type II toxin-antitoxin system death-on-curing family toxin [Chlamydiota bacterium]